MRLQALALICLSPRYHSSAKLPRVLHETCVPPGPLCPKKIHSLPEIADVSGTEALAICERLLFALNDHNILPEREIVGIPKDAAAAHSNETGEDGKADLQKAVAALINGILAGGNSVRKR